MTMAIDLIVEKVTVRFGGTVAVNDASLTALGGMVTGLIGPNGAGKTTTFNACTGLVHPTSGSVRLGDRLLDKQSPHKRAQLGLGRTFQRMQLFESMTVYENVRTGPEAMYSDRHLLAQFFCPPKEARDIRSRADDAMQRCGISHLSRRTVADLSTGQRRLVELARALATPFKFLLLDEPSSGLDHSETDAFGQVLRDFVRDTGCGILLVEHDMTLVAGVCQQIYVLDFGRIIYSGTTSEALASDTVKAAYLGEQNAELARVS
jgi:ABC-type branched-subunit amino acid transport system ATPase component